MKSLLQGWIAAVLALGLAACATPSREPRNLSLLKAEIVLYVDSGRYIDEVNRVAQSAEGWLLERAKSIPVPRDVMLAARYAVVFDIDETMLSNLPHMRRMDFGYEPAAWSEWVARAEAPVIESVRETFREARRLGLEVIFITGRRERDRVGTERNLLNAGVGEYARIYFKPDAMAETSEKFKTATRAQLKAEGYTIIANIGDQESDLAGGLAERTFKLPAPFYFSE